MSKFSTVQISCSPQGPTSGCPALPSITGPARGPGVTALTSVAKPSSPIPLRPPYYIGKDPKEQETSPSIVGLIPRLLWGVGIYPALVTKLGGLALDFQASMTAA